MLDVCVLLTTLHRPAGLARVLQSLRNTAKGIPVVCAIDEDDEQARQLCWAFGVEVVTCPVPRQGPSKAWNTALAAAPNHAAYVLAADDLIFRPGWLEETLTALARLGGSGMVGFNDGKINGNQAQATHYLLTRDFIIKHNGGVMCCPHYRTVGPDTETWERARKVGKYIWAEKALAIHDWHGFDQDADETYKQALPHRGASKAKFYERQAAGFPDDFEPILRGEA